MPGTLRGFRGIVGMSLFCWGLVSGVPSSFAQTPQPKGAAPPAPKVFVAAVRRDTIREPRTFVGTVKPLRKSIVGSAAPGRVEEFLVNEGDAVTKGQPIAFLRRGIIGAEKKAAEAERKVREAELAQWDKSFVDEVAQAKARLQTAQANLAYREAKRERSTSLGAAVTRETQQEDIALAAQAQAAVAEAEATLRLLIDGAREMKTEQARAKLAVQEAEVERLSEQYDRHTMFAPFDGFVTAEHTEIGQWVMQGDPVAEIAELGTVDIEVAVLEDYIDRLSMDTVGTVEVPALRGTHLEGVVAIINPQADTRARTFPVKVRVKNQVGRNGPMLKAGMFARVTLPVGEPMESELIPKDALVLGGKVPLVYVADTVAGKTTVRPVTVTLGASQGIWISVGQNDLKEGEWVVVEGNERLRPMQEVRTEVIQVPVEAPADAEPATDASGKAATNRSPASQRR